MSDLLNVPFQQDVSLQAFNTFGLPALAARFAAIHSEAELVCAVRTVREQGRSFWVLGGGSNLVLTQDVAGCVLHMRIVGKRVVRTDADAWIVEAAAGESWHALVMWTLEQGCAGLENLALIPGTVGAAPIQNIGAYGVEVAQRLESVRVYLPEQDRFETLSAEACEFGYRDSIFKHRLRTAIVVALRLRLPRPWRAEIGYGELKQLTASGEPSPQEICKAVISIRSRKLPDPARVGNAGSFFKNPVVDAATYERIKAQAPELVAYPQAGQRYKLAAGWLIDRCGLKGRRFGRVAVHDQQALVLVNLGGATGIEVLEAARAVQHLVQARFGVELEIEPVVA